MLNSLAKLTELERLEQLKKCDTPEKVKAFGMCYTKHTDKTANGLTKAIIRWIELHGGQAERINTQGNYIKGKTVGVGMYGVKQLAGKYVPSGSTRGSADISCTISGRSVKIEVKIGKDRQSEHQKKYQADIERAGGLYWLCRDFDSFVKYWEGLQ